ncbi:type 4a pilus biogenesis protein PilO [Candidatus Acidulodesulfobacterium sp. H_13]|uniref:type 4a pilus biogenesis protein PilO n=1 Tax=Candidatus Acidulodesulfobacterium sp. H_13 TaxID=3395470 RepID=UPI003AF4AE0B
MAFKKLQFKMDFRNPAVFLAAISVVLFIVIIGIYYYSVYSGLQTKLSQRETILTGVTTRYKSYIKLVKSYPVLLKRDKKLKEEFASLLLELPSKKNIPQFLMEISNYEKVLSLNLKMFKPEKPVAKGFYEEVPFSMSISGNFHNVYKFFYKLASMKRIVDVHDVSMSRTSKGHKISVRFKGTAFSFIGVSSVKHTGRAKKYRRRD